MKSINEKSKRLIKYLCVVAVIFVMVRASDLLDEKEIIFPEIAALSIGCFLAPKLNWQTSYARMIICIEICAAMGMCIVVLIPLPLWIQVALAFAIGQIVFMLSHTSLAPMISAIVLPVLLQTRSPVYLVATLLLTVLVVAIRILLERVSIMEKNTFSPLPAPVKADWGAFAYRAVCVAILACICLRFEGKFFIAPPLLVAFTELSKVGHPAGKNKPKAILLVSLCALAGAAMRFTLVMKCGFSPTVAALAISVLIIILVECVGLYFPPAGAIGVLALLIPDSAVLPYTIEVVLGIMALALTADVWVKCCQRLTKATE